MHALALEEIQIAIERCLSGRGAAGWRVAQALACSESSLHRALRRADTTFVVERNKIRVRIALDLLKQGRPVPYVAAATGVTPDHLRRLIVADVDLTPAQISRAASLGAQLREVPSSFAALATRRANEQMLEALVGGLHARHPLAGWAKQLLASTHLPELRSNDFAAKLRRLHQEQRARRRDESDLRRLDADLVRDAPPDPAAPVWDELMHLERARMFASWRRRLAEQRRLVKE